MNENRNNRLKRALKESKVSQEKLGLSLGISSQAVSERLNKDQEIDSIEFVTTVATLTGFRSLWLLTGTGSERVTDIPTVDTHESRMVHIPAGNNAIHVADSIAEYLSGKNVRPISVVVNQAGKELITLVGVKAQAGYMRGYADVKYVEKLPAFALPIVKEGTHRMFEVDGESMRQLGGAGLNDGDIVIAKYVEDIFSIKDNRVYVIICTDGVLVKRCVNRLKDHDNPMIVAKSDNKTKSDNSHEQYPNIIIRPEEIREIWELTAYISTSLSFSVDLWDTISDLQVHQARMEEKIRAMEQKQLK